MRTLWMLALTAVFAMPAFGNETVIRKVLEPKLGGAKIEGVERGPLGLWEVRYRSDDGVHILYTDATATHIVVGKIYETTADKDLTEERLRKLNAINFSALPLSQAVKVQRGNGKRVLVMFSDPYCPYCKQFEQTLQQIDNITVYVFMFPVIRPNLADHSRAVWCSPDKSKAWLDLALHGKPPAANASCENPVEKNLELGHKLGVNSTPTLYLATGERVAGAMQAADLRAMLDQVPGSASSK
jgi:thiol:disulfide interchange protein DsbC